LVATRHQNIPANLSTSSTSPIGMISDFNKLIFNPNTASKKKKEASQVTKMFTISLTKD